MQYSLFFLFPRKIDETPAPSSAVASRLVGGRQQGCCRGNSDLVKKLVSGASVSAQDATLQDKQRQPVSWEVASIPAVC